MPLTPKGELVERAMEREYGAKEGERVFYASRNKGTITGVDSDLSDLKDRMDALRAHVDNLGRRMDAHERERAYRDAMTGKENAEGELSERTREEIGREGSERREEMPESVFLEPGERKYPVKTKKDGEWTYDRKLLLAAAREARMHGHDALAEKADRIREREFSSSED